MPLSIPWVVKLGGSVALSADLPLWLEALAESPVVVVPGGSLSVATDMVTGAFGNSGVVDVSGGALTMGGYLNMGAGGFGGSVNISGGTVTANNLSINASGGAVMNLGGTGKFVAPVSNLGNVNFWIANAIFLGGLAGALVSSVTKIAAYHGPFQTW